MHSLMDRCTRLLLCCGSSVPLSMMYYTACLLLLWLSSLAISILQGRHASRAQHPVWFTPSCICTSVCNLCLKPFGHAAGLRILWLHPAANGARDLHSSRPAVPKQQHRPAAATAVQQRLPQPLQLAHHRGHDAVPGSLLPRHGRCVLGRQCRDLSCPGVLGAWLIEHAYFVCLRCAGWFTPSTLRKVYQALQNAACCCPNQTNGAGLQAGACMHIAVLVSRPMLVCRWCVTCAHTSLLVRNLCTHQPTGA